jgi:hypothetical protein
MVKTLTVRLLLTVVMSGTFSLFAFGQTQLKLNGTGAELMGEVGGKNG